MKLLVLSDLHLELAPFPPDPQAAAAVDVVVLAGDVDKGVNGIRWAAMSISRFSVPTPLAFLFFATGTAVPPCRQTSELSGRQRLAGVYPLGHVAVEASPRCRT
jgi:hypothetical protein